MSRSLNDFSRRMKVRSNSIELGVTRVVRQVALAADAAVVLGTPVDTGRAKSNWLVQVGAAATETIDAYVPGGGASTAQENEAAARAQAERAVAAFRAGKDQAIHITNNLPYIQRLNDGYSAQAPANFVEEAVSEAAAAVRRAKL